MMTNEEAREAYLSFSAGYLFGALLKIRASGQISTPIASQMDEDLAYIRPILGKVYEDPAEAVNPWILFEPEQLRLLIFDMEQEGHGEHPLCAQAKAELERKKNVAARDRTESRCFNDG